MNKFMPADEMFPILAQVPKEDWRHWFLATPNLWIYSDGFSTAGFAFQRVDGVVVPLGGVSLDSDPDGSLGDLIDLAKKRYGIKWVTLPKVAPEGSGFRQELNKNPLLRQLRLENPENERFGTLRHPIDFDTAKLNRARAIKQGLLNEAAYSGRLKMIERLKQVSKDKPPGPLLWAYLCGIYDTTTSRLYSRESYFVGMVQHERYAFSSFAIGPRPRDIIENPIRQRQFAV